MNEDSPEIENPTTQPKGPNKLAGAAAGFAALATTVTGLGGAADAAPEKPQRPPAVVAEAFPKATSPQKQEITTEVIGTGEHTGGRVSVGIERDTNGTLNTGENGPEPGVPASELIPDVMPNLVIGSSDHQGGTTGDGWVWNNQKTKQEVAIPVPVQVPGKPVEHVTEVVDETKYPIKTPWEQDFHTSPELARELTAAAQDCYAQIEARQNQGYLLTGVQIGGLASDEDNATKPGDPMAGLGEQSKLNQDLANERGLAGMQTMSEVLQSHGIDPAVLSFIEGQEVQATPQEIEQILQYSKMLGQDPLEAIQDYNRARSAGLQPLMDELFQGNRGIVCIASFTKLEVNLLPGPTETKIMMVPIEVDGKQRIWRIEIPGEVLLLPLIYIALRSLPGSGGSNPVPTRSPLPPAGAGPKPPLPKPLVPHRTYPNPPHIKPTGPIDIIKPPRHIPPGPPTPIDFFGPSPKPPKEIGSAQQGHTKTAYQHKQPRPHNMHGSGNKSTGKPMGRSRGGNRQGKRTGTGR